MPYRTVATTETDPLAPLVAALFKALEENPRAMFEGASGAPRLLLAAINRLTLGDSIRRRYDTLQNLATSTFTDVFPPAAIMQSGSIRFKFQFRRTVNGTAEVRVVRRRAGSNSATTAVTTTSATFVDGVIEIDVIPGDLVSVQMRNTNGTSTDIQNLRLCVGVNDFLWPQDAEGNGTNTTRMFGEIEGNPTVLIP